MKFIITISLFVGYVIGAPTNSDKTSSEHKIFSTDPDIVPGQPFWSEWQITTTLINKMDIIPNCTIQSNKKTDMNFDYYYSSYDLSTCSEPMPNSACITIMHRKDLKKYTPYFTWTTFSNVGTLKKPQWTIDLWLNYNHTKTYRIGNSVLCNGKMSTIDVNPCIFNQHDIVMTFDITCKYKNELLYLDIIQTTGNTSFTLHKIKSWRPFTSIIDSTSEDTFVTVETTTLLSNDICKICN